MKTARAIDITEHHLKDAFKIYSGKDVDEEEVAELEDLVSGFEKNLGKDIKAPILYKDRQFFRNLGRTFIPTRVDRIPRTLANAGVAAITPLAPMAGGMMILQSLIGAAQKHSAAYATGPGTVNVAWPEKATLAHELGHALEEEGFSRENIFEKEPILKGWKKLLSFPARLIPPLGAKLAFGKHQKYFRSLPATIDKELRAHLLGRKMLGEDFDKKHKKRMATALATYIAADPHSYKGDVPEERKWKDFLDEGGTRKEKTESYRKAVRSVLEGGGAAVYIQ